MIKMKKNYEKGFSVLLIVLITTYWGIDNQLLKGLLNMAIGVVFGIILPFQFPQMIDDVNKRG